MMKTKSLNRTLGVVFTVLVVALPALIAAPAFAAFDDYAFINIANTAGTTFTNFFAPSLNDSRQMVFLGVGGPSGTGIYQRDSDGTISQIRAQATAGTIAEWTIDDSGRSVFGHSGSGVFFGEPGSMRDVFNAAGPMNVNVQIRQQVNAQGNMGIAGAQAGSSSNRMVSFVEWDDATNFEHRIADNTTAGTPFTWVGISKINDGNDVMFVALNALNQQSIHRGHHSTATNATVLMADSNGTPLRDISDYDTNNNRELLIDGRNDSLTDTLFFVDSGGNLTEHIVFAGPGTQLVNAVAPNLNDAGDIAFQAGSTAWLGFGEWGIFTGPDVDDDRVIGHDDPLFGGTVATVVLVQGGLSESGEIGFYYRLSDGTEGIAIATTHDEPIPEPAGLGLIGVALLAVRKRRD